MKAFILTLALSGLAASAPVFGQTGSSPGSRTSPSSGLPNTGTPGSASATNNYDYVGADPAALFAQLDTNKDGKLSKAEFLKIAKGVRHVEKLSAAPSSEFHGTVTEPAAANEKDVNKRVGTGENGSSTTTGRTETPDTGTGTSTAPIKEKK